MSLSSSPLSSSLSSSTSLQLLLLFLLLIRLLLYPFAVYRKGKGGGFTMPLRKRSACPMRYKKERRKESKEDRKEER